MPIPSSLYLLYECIKDSDPKSINPRKNLERMVDYIIGDPDDIVGQCGHDAVDDDDCWFIEDGWLSEDDWDVEDGYDDDYY